ncbi:MAG: hypothetical protein QOK48_1118 [Blastocatellia bacterium]|nr:hypothetical protein [Blastocatellia bacterium]
MPPTTDDQSLTAAPMLEELNYATSIEEAVKRAVMLGAQSFSEICLASRGAFPVDVFLALQRLDLSEEVLKQDISHCILNKHKVVEDWWPEPSPANHEWRFTHETAERIADTALDCGQRILCLGTPTVFRSLIFRGADARLVDRNPFVRNALPYVPRDRILIADICDRASISGSDRFDVVVMDPPWYPAHVNYWLGVAGELLRDRGTIIVPLFPELTRPFATSERNAILDNLAEFGTYHVALEKIWYETPLFERETLAMLGVPPLPLWRVADLVTLSLNSSTRSLDLVAPIEDDWFHFLFGTQTVAIKKSENADPIRLSAPYEDFTFLLRSVSSREPVRAAIGLWTSRNRVARVTGNARIAHFLKKLEMGSTCRIAMAEVAKDVEEISALEMVVALIGW